MKKDSHCIDLDFTSQVKLKVIERSTGYQNLEEWLFLPKDWNYPLNTWLNGTRRISFARNFVLLKFFTLGNRNADDLLILNLITRKSFWMRTRIIETQAEEKVAGRMDFTDFVMTMSYTSKMIVEDKRVMIEYIIAMDELRTFGDEIKLGWF